MYCLSLVLSKLSEVRLGLVITPPPLSHLIPSQIENEENVLVCLRVIIELHKQYRPSISPEVGVAH